jgi:tetratricopeptide (TPR) repeat protein
LASALAGRYSIEREIGRGGMATVYAARDLRHDRQVALKVLVPSLTSAIGSARFQREIHIAAALTHPHILTVHDSGEADGLLYYVMPYVDGESLRTRLQREHQLPLEDTVRITRDVADALAYAHAHGVVHRDIKPENILLGGGHALVADFGIARAITAAADDDRRLTDSGFTVGTPLYMSPEQAVGESEIDGRADLYALGCVCFEMLTGGPPFTGANAQVVRMRHVAESPPPIRTVRPTVPREIEDIVHRLLAKVPADRFDSATRLLEALPTTTTERAVVIQPRRRRWWQIGGLVGLGVVVAIVASVRGITSFTTLGELEPISSRYVVLPLLEDGPLPAGFSGARVSRDLADALGDWRGIDVVRDFRVRDLLERADEPPRTIKANASIARQLRAGIVIWGDMRAAPGGAQVRAVMYQSTNPDSTLEERMVFVPENGNIRDSMVVLTARLLTSRGHARQQHPTTTDINAYEAFKEGQEAIADWDLPRALAAFDSATQIDPQYAEAYLWRALTQTWAGEDLPRKTSWQFAAQRAAELSDQLPAIDRPYAVALAAMAAQRFDAACAIFDSLVRADSTSFEAWFGLGHCLHNDRAVVRDPRSESGFAFRSSLERAITSYMRALELVPSAHRAFRGAAFDRLPRDMLYASPNVARRGMFVDAADTTHVHAFAALQGDTIAYTPYRSEELFSGAAGPPAAAMAAAAARNRDRLRTVTERWVDAFPSSADAREAFARALEGIGEIAESGDERHSALVQLRLARQAARTPDQQLRLATAQVRLLLKTASFARAGRLADSLLASPHGAVTDPSSLSGLAALAALRGDAPRAAALLARSAADYTFTSPSGRTWTLDRPVAEPALIYLAYAAVGAPPDTLRALERATLDALERFAQPAQRGEFAVATLLRPAILAFPIVGATWIHTQGDQPNPLFTLQRALLAGNVAMLRRTLDADVSERAAFRPGDVSIDQIHQEAELRLAIGDTAAAAALLDRSLSGLPTLGFQLVDHVPESAALVRAMALRAELARQAGDSRTAARWSDAVSAVRSRTRR